MPTPETILRYLYRRRAKAVQEMEKARARGDNEAEIMEIRNIRDYDAMIEEETRHVTD